MADLDDEFDVAVVMGKGRRPRSCPFGAKIAQAIDRYLYERDRHRQRTRRGSGWAIKGPPSATR